MPRPLQICHRCDRRQAGCNGACACRVTGRDIAEQSRLACPLNRFAAPAAVATPTRLAAAPWPRLARLVAWRRRPGEAGVGSTLKRLLANAGADALAAWYTRITGRDCGCGDRAARLDRDFPYPPSA